MSELVASMRPWRADEELDDNRSLRSSPFGEVAAVITKSSMNAKGNLALIQRAANNIESLEQRVTALREALEKAQGTIASNASTFAFYADNHRLKGTEEGHAKAARNDAEVEVNLNTLEAIRTALHNDGGRDA